MKIKAIEPYRLHLWQAVVARFRHPIGYTVCDDKLWMLQRHRQGLVLVQIGSQDSTLELEVLAHTQEIAPRVLREQVAEALGCYHHLGEFYDFAKQDKTLWQVIEPLEGLPIPRSNDLYTALISLIIEQHIAWTSAQDAQYRLLQWADNRITYDDETFYAFPTPEQLASADLEDLFHLKITHKRIQMLIDISRQFVSRELDLYLPSAQESAEALYQHLLSIKGVGHWTASNVISRAFGLYPYVPHNDVAVQAAVNWYFHGEEGRLDAKELQAQFAEYGEYGGLVAHFTLLRWVIDRYPIVNLK